MRVLLEKIKNEDGNTVIEASFVVTSCIIVIFMIIIFGFIFYQESLLQSVANQTANSIARTYPYQKKDPITGYIGKNNLADQGLIESAYFLSGDISGKNDKEKREAEELLNKLLDNNRIMIGHQVNPPQIEIKDSDTVMFQKEITVTVEEYYNIPFAKLFGISEQGIPRKYTGRAICVDIVGANSYHNLLNVITEQLGSQAPAQAIQKIAGIIESFANTGVNVGDLISKIFGGN